MIIATAQPPTVASIVTRAVQPLMQRYGIPGMAVGIVVNGPTYVLTYGVGSRATKQPINAATLFEIGSVSKTFTATLASYAQLTGKLSFADTASTDLPVLRGSSFDRVSLLNLGTYTAGGLPLQVPDDITNDAQLMSYLQHWKPPYPPGTYRLYSNVSIGLLGFIAAARVHEDFVPLMQSTLLQPLGLRHTYLNVPNAQMSNYAQGYTSKDTPIRMVPGELAAETYGVRITAGDLLRWLQANLGMLPLDPTLQRALINTHTGYYRSGPITQDLIWEQYLYPVTLAQLEQGNATTMLLDALPAIAIDPPQPPHDDVLLANKSYPIPARIATAYQILTNL